MTVLSKSSDSSDLPDTSRLAIPDGRVSAPSPLESEERLGLLEDELGSNVVPESLVVSMMLPPTGEMGDVVGVWRVWSWLALGGVA